MNVVYYFLIDAGSVLAPAVLGGCWYALALGAISTGTDDGIATAA